jgi:hypothetical protein
LFTNNSIPNTNIKLAFIEYDASAFDTFQQYMTPNSKTNSIYGLKRCSIAIPCKNTKLITEYLNKIFDQVSVINKKQVVVHLSYGQQLVFELGDNISEPLVCCEAYCGMIVFLGNLFQRNYP